MIGAIILLFGLIFIGSVLGHAALYVGTSVSILGAIIVLVGVIGAFDAIAFYVDRRNDEHESILGVVISIIVFGMVTTICMELGRLLLL